MRPRETLEAFDRYLTGRGLRLEAVVIGGAALNLLGVISRATKDCDILDPPLPSLVIEAARSFAAEARTRGVVLQDDWLNNGPASLVSVLPPGWRERLQSVFSGSSIELRCLGREDLLRSKLFALCDRGFDLGDCLALAPSADELRAILPWLEQQDRNPDWPAHVRATLVDLGGRLGHGV
jgi:hypothetical protein